MPANSTQPPPNNGTMDGSDIIALAIGIPGLAVGLGSLLIANCQYRQMRQIRTRATNPDVATMIELESGGPTPMIADSSTPIEMEQIAEREPEMGDNGETIENFVMRIMD